MKEHEAARWLAREDLFSVDWLPADVDLVEKIAKLMENGAERRIFKAMGGITVNAHKCHMLR